MQAARADTAKGCDMAATCRPNPRAKGGGLYTKSGQGLTACSKPVRAPVVFLVLLPVLLILLLVMSNSKVAAPGQRTRALLSLAAAVKLFACVSSTMILYQLKTRAADNLHLMYRDSALSLPLLTVPRTVQAQLTKASRKLLDRLPFLELHRVVGSRLSGNAFRGYCKRSLPLVCFSRASRCSVE